MEKTQNNGPTVLVIEVFYGGSHKASLDRFLRYLTSNNYTYTLITLPAKKWHWRARCGAMQIFQMVPKITTERILWCSSVLNLTELLGLRQDLCKLRKYVYFHENQLVYPVQVMKSRDVQYGYNQITTCLSADGVFFNSEFNRTSFLENINKVLKLLPDHRPKNFKTIIESKSSVLYFPVSFPKGIQRKSSSKILRIAWAHRWEFDKGPDDFFNVLFKLKEEHLKFEVSILGEIYHEVPDVFDTAKDKLHNEIINFGFVENREEYYDILASSHVAVSSARHEFFGVSMLEATYCGCFPLVPNKLVYPEIYPSECLYNDQEGLYKKLKVYCLDPDKATQARAELNLDFSKFSDEKLMPKYLKIIESK